MKHEVQSPGSINESHRKRTLASDTAIIRERFRKNPEGLIVPLGISATAAVVFLVGGNLADTQNQEPDRYTDILNSDTTQLIIEDGANIRNDPIVRNGEDNNLIDSLDLSDDTVLIVNSPEGVYIKENTVDGDWYGIPAVDLVNVDGTKQDKDGIVWINDVNAYPANPPIDN